MMFFVNETENISNMKLLKKLCCVSISMTLVLALDFSQNVGQIHIVWITKNYIIQTFSLVLLAQYSNIFFFLYRPISTGRIWDPV